MATDAELTLLVVGDVFVQQEEPAKVFQHVTDTLRSGDFRLGNLEAAIADSGTPWPKGMAERIFKSDARQIAAIQAAGFDAMSVANNHILDFGYDALFETLGYLDGLGVAHTGAGRNDAEAHTPAIVERAGCRVALLAYTSVFVPGWAAGPNEPGLAVIRVRTAYEPSPRASEQPGSPPPVHTWAFPEDKARLGDDIAAARRQAEIVVCSFHWGISQGYIKLADYQMEVARHAVDAGADLLFGHHPHVPQGVEVYRGRPIFYSLGNFSFARHNPEQHDYRTLIIRCQIRDRRIVAAEFLPVRTDAQLRPHVLDLEQGRDVVQVIEERSRALGTRFVPSGDAIRLVLT